MNRQEQKDGDDGAAQALADIRARIGEAEQAAGRAAGSVTLIAVSKTFGGEAIEPLIGAGQTVFGENRVQEAAAKWPPLRARHGGLALHLIGPLQSNKVAQAVALFDAIHTVDRPKIARLIGEEMANKVRDVSIALYSRAREMAEKKGIIIADTKFEFGLADGEYLLIDEVLTPDSSRFWPANKYEAGRDQESFDKQFVRNYLTTLVEAGKWDKTPPGPQLPDDIVKNTVAKYREACEQLMK